MINTQSIIIPPILKDGKLESDFEIKADYFNSFFASQCTPLLIKIVNYQAKLL